MFAMLRASLLISASVLSGLRHTARRCGLEKHIVWIVKTTKPTMNTLQTINLSNKKTIKNIQWGLRGKKA
jgi:hypothetical protein